MSGSSQQTTEKKEGKGNKPNAAETLADVEENILYEKNVLGISLKCRSFAKHSVAFQFGAFWLGRLRRTSVDYLGRRATSHGS